ncbi:gastrin-releasing peptide isoform X1 [Tamandua tetradactyla]|uniref:gastrin-releasing peptide isoform X1 n=1 Tax=Tamandua tetradactyla TaxID=48850 RepID=UPI004053BAB0
MKHHVISEVGHLMGKKSTGEFPYVYGVGNLNQQPWKDLQWDEAARNLLGLIRAKENRGSQSPQRRPLGSRQPTWDSEDGSKFKDVGSKEEVGGLAAPGSRPEGKHPQLNGW